MNVQIGKPAPDFVAETYHDDKVKKVSLKSLRGKWVVLAFYPKDFTFICPTELGELADKYATFKKLNAEVLSVSVDTPQVHKAWHDTSPTINKITFPMLSDPTHAICAAYGTLLADEGISTRATVIIDPTGIVRWFEMHDNSIGRSTAEILRKLQAAQYVAKHPGEVCPVSWTPGSKTLRPGLDLVGKI
jgi:peroxiredoxin (alkyl hydroperoxide reductase subunit C)